MRHCGLVKMWEGKREKNYLNFTVYRFSVIKLIGTKCFFKQNASKLRVDIVGIHSTWLSRWKSFLSFLIIISFHSLISRWWMKNFHLLYFQKHPQNIINARICSHSIKIDERNIIVIIETLMAHKFYKIKIPCIEKTLIHDNT